MAAFITDSRGTETQSVTKWVLTGLVLGPPALPHNPQSTWMTDGLNITSLQVPLTQTRGAKDTLAKIILFAPPGAILKLDPENKLTT